MRCAEWWRVGHEAVLLRRYHRHFHVAADRGDRAMRKGKRIACFARDGWRCLACGSTEDLTVDHVVPKSMGGTGSLTNLQTLCKPCNLAKANKIIQYNTYPGTRDYIAEFYVKKNAMNSPGEQRATT